MIPRLPSRARAVAAALLLGALAGSAHAQTATSPAAPAPAASSTPAAAAPDAAAPTNPAGATPSAQPASTSPSPAPAVEEPSAAPIATLPQDMSPWAMFRRADIVVKVVMGLLAAASVTTWTIFIAKRLELAGARFRAVRAVRELLRAGSLGELEQARQKAALKTGPVAALVHAAAHERERSASLPPDGIKERAAIALQRIEARAARTMSRGTGLVASIGSTAPFVGLFGTVWGIMNSFVGISQAHTTNLAVVAPGIAEALLATAIGLVAAIPAVIIYNGLARATAGYRAILSDASAEIMRHLSRDLDRQLGPAE